MTTDTTWCAHAGRSILTAIVAGFACLAITDANAATFPVTVQSGQPRVLKLYQAWQHNKCYSLGVKVNVTAPPDHGVVNARVENTTITNATHGSVGTCAGVPIKGLAIEYKSADSFHGMDAFQ